MDMNFKLEEISKAANWFLENIKQPGCVAFHGEMGAGKTTFITAVCASLGVQNSLGSPTFSIINEYHTSKEEVIYHIDLYRLKDEQEAFSAGVEDCMYSGNFCFVEWPERAKGLFPVNTIHCYITTIGTDTRNLKLIL